VSDEPDAGVESWPTLLVVDGRAQELPDPVAVEEPLEIVLLPETPDGGPPAPLTVTMRTPGADAELAAGFLYGEGLIESGDDLVLLRDPFACGVENRVEVRLRGHLARAARERTRAFLSTSACGLCGKTTIESVFARGLPLAEAGLPRVGRALLEALPARMRAAQRLFARTGGVHAAALFDPGGALLALREDVGRHNAVDKLVGARLLAGTLPARGALLVLSGRAGFEITQKAARAGIGLVAAVGAPSSLSLRIAERAGLTLVGFLRAGRLNVYTGRERVGID
jgi:formate dehydrogenase accessory protein FdhD